MVDEEDAPHYLRPEGPNGEAGGLIPMPSNGLYPESGNA